MENYLTIGIILGLSAGFAPGPLLTLVVSQTLQHDIKSGIKVAVAPAITDLPIIVISLFILTKLSNFNDALGIVSLIGGLFVFAMSYESISTKGYEIGYQEENTKPVIKGVLTNALSPHPYLFWFSVGGPTMTNAVSQNIFAPLAFIFGFYVFLVGSKILLAILVGKSKSFLRGKTYIFIMRFLGILLCVFAFILFRDGLELLGII